MPKVRQKFKTEMYDIIDTVPELDNCNIIAFHLVSSKNGKSKISIIADNEFKEIIKVDIFAKGDNLTWTVERGV